MKMNTCHKDSFQERFQKHEPSHKSHKNLHSEKSGISLGLADFNWAESRKLETGFQAESFPITSFYRHAWDHF